jgi:hypothetical protein
VRRRLIPISAAGLLVALAFLILPKGMRPPVPARAPATGGEMDRAGPGAAGPGPPTAVPAEDAGARAGEAAICGLVLDAESGEPVAGAGVRALEPAGGTGLVATTGAEGRFELPATAGRGGLTTLVIAATGYARIVENAVRPAVEPAVWRLVRGGALSGRVVALPDRRPVTTCRVLAVRLAFTAAGSFDPATALRRQALPEEIAAEAIIDVADPDGRFAFAGLRPGTYALVVLAEGFPPKFENGAGDSLDRGRGLEVGPDMPAGEVVVELALAGVVRFRVRDAATGEPLFDVRFRTEVEVERRAFPLPLRPLSVGADGVYELPVGVETEGRMAYSHFLIEKDGYAPRFFSFGGWPDGHLFEAALSRPARVRGGVRGPDGAPAAAVILVERDLDGGLVTTVSTDGQGLFETGPIDAWIDVTLHVLDAADAGLLATVPLRLAPGEIRTVDIGEPGTGAVFGRAGLGGEAARVRVCLDADAGRRTIAWIGTGGDYRFEGLPPDAYEVTALFDDPEGRTLATMSRRFVLGTGERAQVDLLPVLSVSGTVRVGEERAPPGVEIEIAARPAGAEGPVSTATAAPDGTFRLGVPGPGLYVIDCPESDDFVARAAPRVDLAAGGSAEGVELLVDRDDRDGVVRIEVRDAETGEMIAEGGYEYRHETVVGAGSFENGVIETEECGLGSWHFEIEAEGYARASIDLDLSAAINRVERVARLARPNALRVDMVLPGSPAGAAGLAEGDVILEYGGRRVRTLTEIRETIEGRAGGVAAELGLIRDGAALVLTVPSGRLGVVLAEVRAEER